MRCEMSMCDGGPNVQPICTRVTYIHRLSFDRPTSFFISKKLIRTYINKSIHLCISPQLTHFHTQCIGIEIRWLTWYPFSLTTLLPLRHPRDDETQRQSKHHYTNIPPPVTHIDKHMYASRLFFTSPFKQTTTHLSVHISTDNESKKLKDWTIKRKATSCSTVCVSSATNVNMTSYFIRAMHYI